MKKRIGVEVSHHEENGERHLFERDIFGEMSLDVLDRHTNHQIRVITSTDLEVLIQKKDGNFSVLHVQTGESFLIEDISTFGDICVGQELKEMEGIIVKKIMLERRHTCKNVEINCQSDISKLFLMSFFKRQLSKIVENFQDFIENQNIGDEFMIRAEDKQYNFKKIGEDIFELTFTNDENQKKQLLNSKGTLNLSRDFQLEFVFDRTSFKIPVVNGIYVVK